MSINSIIVMKPRGTGEEVTGTKLCTPASCAGCEGAVLCGAKG